MVFNSTSFAGFVALVLCLYWLVDRRRETQNIILLIANYLFYCTWSWKYAGFLFGVTLTSYVAAMWIEGTKDPQPRKQKFVITVLLLASLLVYLKYLSFLVTSGVDAMRVFGLNLTAPTWKLLLPVGISCYAFIAIGYVVDVYRGQTRAETNWVTYFAYMSFFPHILSGPIARSATVLPQFMKSRTPSWPQIQSGLAQLVWGLFKKLAIADTIGREVNYVFFNYKTLPGSVLWVGMVLYSFQVYCDFSGYSDMARGIGQLLGIDLAQNFKQPFISRDVGEFWRKWHTSLSNWLKDYVYIPIGGRSPVKALYIRNLLITFAFSGLWHGPKWTFVVWGVLNGLYFVPYVLVNRLKKWPQVVAADRAFPTGGELGGMLLTFFLISLSRVFFRSEDMVSASIYVGRMFSSSVFAWPHFGWQSLLWIVGLVAVEWIQRRREHVLDIKNRHPMLQLAAYGGVISLIIFSGGASETTEYLYFKF